MRATIMNWRTGIGCLTLAALLLTNGCASTSDAVPDKQVATRVWPEAPNDPRITYVRAFSRPADLGIKKGFFQQLSEFFVGESDAHLVRPMAVVETSDGSLYVADPGAKGVQCFAVKQNHYRLIQAGEDQPLPSPVGLTVGARDEVYVTDSVLAKILVIEPGADQATPLALEVALQQPTGLVFDPVGQQLLVVDTAAHQIVVIGLDGKERARFGRRGSADGEFNFPTMIGRDNTGRLYVTDSLNFRIQMLDSAGHFLGQFGHHGNASGDLSRPKGVATDHFGHVYVVDSLFHALQIFDRDGTFLLDIGGQGQAVGEFWLPTGLFISNNDTIYVADSHNQRVQVLRYIGDKP
jgi:DNA-binding beta-propeller fold protein YncE